MQPVRKISCYDFGLQVQAFADQINGSTPSSIHSISTLVMNVLTDATWLNPGVGTACRNLSLALNKLPPSDTRKRVKDKLATMQFPLPKELIEMILKRAFHKGYGYPLAALLCTCKSFRTIVATEINQAFRQLRIARLLQEERFAFLDKIEENSYAGYLALKAVVTPTLSVQNVKNCANIPFALLRMPGLSLLEWDVAYKAEGGVPLELEGLEHAKPGMMIRILHALIPTIPSKTLRELALISFNDCTFSDGYRNVECDLQSLKHRFIVIFKTSQCAFPLLDLGTIEPNTGVKLDPRIRYAEGIVTIDDESMLNYLDFSRMFITQLMVNKVNYKDEIPLSLLLNEGLTLLQWKVAHQKPLNLDNVFSAKIGMTIEISNASMHTFSKALQGIATLIFSNCYFAKSADRIVEGRLEPAKPFMTVAFKGCIFLDHTPAVLGLVENKPDFIPPAKPANSDSFCKIA